MFNVSSGVTLALTNLTIANGNAAFGAGVDNAGTLTVTNCTFSGNLANAQNSVGGGIFNSGTATVTNSTFSGNSAEFGGAIYNNTDSSPTTGILSITGSTFSGNTSSAVGRDAGNGGAIDNSGFTVVINSTFSGNHAAVGGGAIENESAGAVEVFNATFWGNSALAGGGIEDDATVAGVQGFVLLNGTLLESEASGGNCSGFISDNGYNIADDESCELGSTSVNGEPSDSLVPPLQNNGGPTKTIAISFVSNATGFIPIADCTKGFPPTALTTDQRGAPRPAAGNPNFCDAGAFQNQFSIVTNTNDSGAGSLRQAILASNAMPSFGDIVVIEAAGTITLTSGALPEVSNTSSQGLEIVAAVPGVIVSGGNSFPIFGVSAGATFAVGGLTIANGNSTNGAGIFNQGTLTVDGCTLANNTIVGGFGGGIDNFSGATMTVVNSTFAGNSASGGDGGGIANGGTMTVTNSTFAHNTGGGFFFNDGGIYNENTATLKGTILGDGAGGNCGLAASLFDAGYNIDDDGSCGFSAPSVSDSTTLKLDPLGLQNNGGLTQTIALEAGSEASDFIPIASCTDQSSPPNR